MQETICEYKVLLCCLLRSGNVFKVAAGFYFVLILVFCGMRGVSPILVIVSLTVTAILFLRAEFFLKTEEIQRQLRLLQHSNIVKERSDVSEMNELEKETMDEKDIDQKIFLSPEKECKPRHQIAFAKTHKTGSSSLQNILLRHGDTHNLTFALPKNSWMFDFKRPFELTMLSNPPWTSIDLFVYHSVWNYDEVRKVLPSALYVTLLREPVACFESNYVYMGLQVNKFLDGFNIILFS